MDKNNTLTSAITIWVCGEYCFRNTRGIRNKWAGCTQCPMTDKQKQISIACVCWFISK